MTSTDEVIGDEHRFVKWHTNHFATSSKYFKSTYFENTEETRLENTVSKPVHDKFILGAPTNYYYSANINTQGNINRSVPLIFESDILDFVRDKKGLITEIIGNQLNTIIDNAVYGKKIKELSHKFINFKIFKKGTKEPLKIYLQSSLQNYIKRFDFFISDEEKTEKDEQNVLYLRFVPSNLPEMLRNLENFDTHNANTTSLSKSFKKWQQHDSDDGFSKEKEFICKRILCTRKDYYDMNVLYGTVKLQPTSSKNSVKLTETDSEKPYVKILDNLRFHFTASYKEDDEFHIIPSITDRHKCLKLVKKDDIKFFIDFLKQIKEEKEDKYPAEYITAIKNFIIDDLSDIGAFLKLFYHFQSDSTLLRIWTKHCTAKVPEFELVFTPLSMWKVCCDMAFKEDKEKKEVEEFIKTLPLKKIKVFSPKKKTDQESYINEPMDIYVHTVKDEKDKIKNFNILQRFEDIPETFNMGEIILNKLRGIRKISQKNYDSEAKKFCRLILSETETQFGNRFKQRYGQVCSFKIRHALMKFFAKKSLTKKKDGLDLTYTIKVSDELPFENASIEVKLSLGFFFPKGNPKLFVYTTDYGVKMGVPLMYQKNLQIVPQLLSDDDDDLKSNSLFGSKYCVFINSEDCQHENKDKKTQITPLFHRYKMYAIILSLIDYLKNTTIQSNPMILVVKTIKNDNLWRSQLSFVLKLFPLGSSSLDLSFDDPRGLALFQKNVYEIIKIDGETAKSFTFSSNDQFLVRPFPTLEELTTMMRFLLEKGDQLFIEEYDKEPGVPVKGVCSSIDFMCMDIGSCEDDCDMGIDFMMHGMGEEITEPDTPRTRRRDLFAGAAEASLSKEPFVDPLDTDDDDETPLETVVRKIAEIEKKVIRTRHADAAEARASDYTSSEDDALPAPPKIAASTSRTIGRRSSPRLAKKRR